MEKREPVLSMRDLAVSFQASFGKIRAVRGVNMDVYPGETVAIVGESGSGKSVSVKTIMGITAPNAVIESGTIKFRFKENGKEQVVDLLKLSKKEMQHRIKGKRIAMVFQDPMTSLNPTIKIGKQIAEAVIIHNKNYTKEQVDQKVLELMELVGISHPKERYHQYPWQFSGGMRQRCVMAIALASDPDILFADEPTTALDVTIQAQILDLLREIQMKLGTATILVSHDLGVVARVADRVAVMYAGKIVEIGTAEEVYYDPRHPYTWGLMRSLPAFANGKESLYTIPGMPPTLIDPPKGDAFACRNEYALNIDYEEMPPMFKITDTHYAATWLLDPRAPQIKSPMGGQHSE